MRNVKQLVKPSLYFHPWHIIHMWKRFPRFPGSHVRCTVPAWWWRGWPLKSCRSTNTKRIWVTKDTRNASTWTWARPVNMSHLVWGWTRKWWRGARGEQEQNQRGFRRREIHIVLFILIIWKKILWCCTFKTGQFQNNDLILCLCDFKSSGDYSNTPEASFKGSFELWLHKVAIYLFI